MGLTKQTNGSGRLSCAQRLALWVAQGGGTGRSPWAPGTVGSLVGVLWHLLLLTTGSLWLYLTLTLAGLGLSVWLCGLAEKILQERDPGSIVLDEIAAIPLCFVATLIIHPNPLAEPLPWLEGQGWAWTLWVFIAFRLFDILKPWPIRQSQHLHGGIGITADDALAALYVNVVALPVAWLFFT